MYYQERNKGYPKCVCLNISKLQLILAIANLLVHNNITISYYVQVNSLLLISSVTSKCASKYLWGTIYFAVDGTLKKNIFKLTVNEILMKSIIQMIYSLDACCTRNDITSLFIKTNL